MTIIQVIGLPGSGKTTYIKQYLENNSDILYLDISNFVGKRRDHLFAKAIATAPCTVIAESACGVKGLGFIIKINTPIDQVYERLMKRDKHFDEGYLSQLSTQMITPNCTLTRANDLPNTLASILRR
jgi:dephospho-CoA kinase